jgi:hypothetical protein
MQDIPVRHVSVLDIAEVDDVESAFKLARRHVVDAGHAQHADSWPSWPVIDGIQVRVNDANFLIHQARAHA